MSTWIEIKKQEDVEYDESPMTDPAIDVLLSSDNFGNKYVSIPVEFILNVLTKEGYDIRL